MGIQSLSAYSAFPSVANSLQQRQTSVVDDAGSTTGGVDKVTISPAARERAAEEGIGTDSYDFTNMTPKQMMKVSQELYDSGQIDNKQHLMLLATGLTFGRMGENGQHIQPTAEEIALHNNTPMNYEQYITDRISYLESTGQTSDPQYGYESWKDLLATFQGRA
nr:hypothetical protein [uncultured Desulfuromonas sp.]